MPLAAGDEYIITFVNYNKGAEGSNYWANWAFISDVFNCRADHGASNPFWGSATNVNYTGSSWDDIYSDIPQWLQAYNGVTVTLTVSRNAAGDGITIAHTATTNAVDAIASQTYAGTFTATVNAETAINFYLTVENAHLNIHKVVHRNADGGSIYTTRVTHISGSDADVNTSYGFEFNPTTGYNKISGGAVDLANKGWGVNNVVYVQVDATDVPTSGVTITSASLTMNAYGTGRQHNVGIGYNSSEWSSTMTWNTAVRSITTLGDTQPVVKNGNSALNYNILDIVTAGNTKTLLVYDTAAGGSPLWDIIATINYSTETLYTATFTESNSLNPSVTIYSDSERYC